MTDNIQKKTFAGFFKKVLSVIKKAFSSLGDKLYLLKTLTIMQLKEKLDMSYLRSFKRTLFKAIWLIVEFAVITVGLRLVLSYVKMLRIFSYLEVIPISVITILFSIMFVLSVISSTAGLVKSLYFSRDNMVLLTLPATPSMVFLSKLAVYYLYEFRKNFMFTIPLFIAFGMVSGYGTIYYPWIVLMFVFISALPVIIASLLSIPFMFVYQWVKKYKILQYAVYALCAVAGVFAVIAILTMLPEEIDIMENWGSIKREVLIFLDKFKNFFLIAPLHGFTQLVAGSEVGLNIELFTDKTVTRLLILLGISVALLTLTFFLAKPLFYKMASKPFEYNKKAHAKQKSNKKLPGFFSALKKEVISGLRNNSILTLAVVLVLLMPVGIRVLNLIYNSMKMSTTGKEFTVAFNVLIILMILLTTNIKIASTYSRDGSTAYLNKIQPLGYGKLLFAKLVINLVLGLVGTVVTMVIYKASGAHVMPKDLILIGITIYAVFVAHLFWSAEMDILNPQYMQYATFNEQANNPNENTSALLVVILSALLFVITLFFGKESLNTPWLKIMIIAIVFASVKILTYFMKIKAFYKEKQ